MGTEIQGFANFLHARVTAHLEPTQQVLQNLVDLEGMAVTHVLLPMVMNYFICLTYSRTHSACTVN